MSYISDCFLNATGEMPSWNDKPSMDGHVSDGTTLVAVVYEGGVVVGVDSRTSSGSIVVSRVTDKITPLLGNVVCLRSGTTAHSQAMADAVRTKLKLYEIEQRGKPVTVKVAAEVFREICYRYRDDLSASIMVAGWDPIDGGQIYHIPSGGMIIRQNVGCSGSGTTYVYGFVDSGYNPTMKKEECKEFVKKAVALAMSRDGGSGGVMRLAVIDKSGIEKELVAGDKLARFSV